MSKTLILAAVLLPAVLAAQEARFADDLDVELVNVDVVAEGEDGPTPSTPL